VKKLKNEQILLRLEANAITEPTYSNRNKLLQVRKRYKQEIDDEEFYIEHNALQKEYGIQPKERATYKELYEMIGMVLETGLSGTKVIRLYAGAIGKDSKWINEVARPKPKKLFKLVLSTYADNGVIKSMIANNTYIEKDIINNTVTGALTKLSKQLAASNEKDNDKNKISMLQEDLKIKASLSKTDKKDWIIGQQLRNSGKTVREVADILGCSPAGVSKYTTPYKS
jgi:hypothetical protein